MGLLIVLFLALGHHFVLGLSLSASGSSRTCPGLQGAEGKVGVFAVGAGGVPVHARTAQQAGQCCSELSRPTWGRIQKESGANTRAADISRALVHKAEGHYTAIFDARTCPLQGDINWMAHSSTAGAGHCQKLL